MLCELAAFDIASTAGRAREREHHAARERERRAMHEQLRQMHEDAQYQKRKKRAAMLRADDLERHSLSVEAKAEAEVAAAERALILEREQRARNDAAARESAARELFTPRPAAVIGGAAADAAASRRADDRRAFFQAVSGELRRLGADDSVFVDLLTEVKTPRCAQGHRQRVATPSRMVVATIPAWFLRRLLLR